MVLASVHAAPDGALAVRLSTPLPRPPNLQGGEGPLVIGLDGAVLACGNCPPWKITACHPDHCHARVIRRASVRWPEKLGADIGPVDPRAHRSPMLAGPEHAAMSEREEESPPGPPWQSFRPHQTRA